MEKISYPIASQPQAELSWAQESLQHIDALVEFYDGKLKTHPIGKLAKQNTLNQEILREFAKIQFVDSTMWIPMLSLIKGRINQPRMLKAVTDNILCESGYAGVPHTTLCAKFAQSVGVDAFFGDCSKYSPLSAHPVEIMNSIMGMSEAQLCGWLLIAETLVPTLFALFRPAFASMESCDLTYLDEHISVDVGEHSKWMHESAFQLLQEKDCLDEIIAGIDIGGRLTLSVPDVLYSRALRN